MKADANAPLWKGLTILSKLLVSVVLRGKRRLMATHRPRYKLSASFQIFDTSDFK